MLLTLIAIAGGCFLIGALGAMMKAEWALFFLFPALAAAVTTPAVAGLVTLLMVVVELLSGADIRAAYGAEAFWSACLIAGMALGILFALMAVAAERQKRRDAAPDGGPA